MMRRTKVLIWLLVQVVVIGGMVSYYFWTTSKRPGTCASSADRHGLITGILCVEEKPSAVIDGEVVHEGETIHGVKVVKIYRDKVEFEKNSKRWTQQPREEPSSAWPIKG